MRGRRPNKEAEAIRIAIGDYCTAKKLSLSELRKRVNLHPRFFGENIAHRVPGLEDYTEDTTAVLRAIKVDRFKKQYPRVAQQTWKMDFRPKRNFANTTFTAEEVPSAKKSRPGGNAATLGSSFCPGLNPQFNIGEGGNDGRARSPLCRKSNTTRRNSLQHSTQQPAQHFSFQGQHPTQQPTVAVPVQPQVHSPQPIQQLPAGDCSQVQQSSQQPSHEQPLTQPSAWYPPHQHQTQQFLAQPIQHKAYPGQAQVHIQQPAQQPQTGHLGEHQAPQAQQKTQPLAGYPVQQPIQHEFVHQQALGQHQIHQAQDSMNEVGHTRAPVQEVEVTSVTSKISNCILKTEATKTAPEMLDLAHPPALVTKAIEDSAIFREQLELARESHQNKGSTSSYDFVDRCSTDQSNLKSFEIIVNHEDEKHLVIEQHTSKAISEAEYKLATLDNNAAVASNTRKAELDKEVAQLMSEHARKEIEYTNKVAEDRISLQELKQDLLNQQQQDRQNRDQCITKSRCMVELGKRAINLVSKTAKTGVIDTKEEKAIKEGSAAYKSSDFSRMKKEILNIDLLPESIDE